MRGAAQCLASARAGALRRRYITAGRAGNTEGNSIPSVLRVMQVQLKNRRTHSTQTVLSHYRREAETQHYDPRDASTNTGVSTATNPPKLVTYMRGLRGDPAQKVNVVTLKLDL